MCEEVHLLCFCAEVFGSHAAHPLFPFCSIHCKNTVHLFLNSRTESRSKMRWGGQCIVLVHKNKWSPSYVTFFSWRELVMNDVFQSYDFFYLNSRTAFFGFFLCKNLWKNQYFWFGITLFITFLKISNWCNQSQVLLFHSILQAAALQDLTSCSRQLGRKALLMGSRKFLKGRRIGYAALCRNSRELYEAIQFWISGSLTSRASKVRSFSLIACRILRYRSWRM
jgi:hypothetical protein